jgi:transcriptional regulator with AAA-type ATPase domain
MDAIKRRAARLAVRRNNGKRMAACRELGITKDTLRRLLAGPKKDE